MDELVTIFGGGGFLGRYVTQELLRRGARVRVAQRDVSDVMALKPLAGLGQLQLVPANVTKPATVQRAVAGATAVINLVGVLKGAFEAVHVEGARTVAEAAKTAGVRSLVHLSAIGADSRAASRYGRSKGDGEAAVRQAFEAATIIRPSIVFGPEDDFVNRFAGMIVKAPVLPVVREGVRFQPVWVTDVARAIAEAALNPKAHAAQTYELGGPQVLTMGELMHWIGDAVGRKPRLLPLPDAIGAGLARFTGWLPGAPITSDQWLMLQKDNVAAGDAAGFAAFGIEPTPLAAVAPTWLVRYRRQGRFSLTASA